MNWHWRASCVLNRVLLGQRDQPVCARVYATKPSRLRAVFLFVMDIAFSEYQHCHHIHRRWMKH